jgi:hypothetical protein
LGRGGIEPIGGGRREDPLEVDDQLGGSRHEGSRSGTTVIIPNRSRWANLWGISAEEVEIVESTDGDMQSLRLDPARSERARARNRLMRD